MGLLISVLFVVSSTFGSIVSSYPSDHLLTVIVTHEEGEYDLGSEVTFTVHVLEDCEYVDADEVNVTAGYSDLWGNVITSRQLEVSNVGTGLYQGTFVIVEDDVNEPGQAASLRAYVERGPSNASGGALVYLVEFLDLDIVPFPEDGGHFIGPEEDRMVTWHTVVRDELVDSDIEIRVDNGIDREPVEVERIGKGRYECVMEVPPGTTRGYVRLYANADHTTPGGRLLEGSYFIDFYILSMHLWAKRLSVSEVGASFDLHVSDRRGVPMVGAELDLLYTFKKGTEPTTTGGGWINGTTDAEGIARIDLDFEDIGDSEYDVKVEGTVTKGDIVQKVRYRLFIRDIPPSGPWEPSMYGLDVDDHDDPLEFDKAETWTGTVYMDGEPLERSWLHCYLVSDYGLMAHENVSTDSEGTFSFEFQTPEKGIWPGNRGDTVYFAPAPEGKDHPYEKDRGGLLLGEPRWPASRQETLGEYLRGFESDGTTVTVTGWISDRSLDISIVHPDSGPGWRTHVYMGLDPGYGEERVPEWTYWTLSGVSTSSTKYGGGLLYDSCQMDNGVWSSQVVVPENVPSEGLFIWVEMWEVGTILNVRSAMTDVEEPEPDGESDEFAIPRELIISVAIVVAVIIVAIIIVRRQYREDLQG